MRKLWTFLYAALVSACVCIMGAVAYCHVVLPDAYTVSVGEDVLTSDWVSVSAAVQAEKDQPTGETAYAAPLRLLGVVPIKQVTVSVVDEPVVTVCGTPFGIKLYTDGVLIVGMADVVTAAGGVNPAAAAGVRVGDTILSIDGKTVTTNEEVAACINACGGRAVTLRIRRDGVEFTVSFVPARPAEGGGYRAGMWVRDSTAGVGTLTFYDAESGAFAGLGHPVCDADTGQILSIASGEIVPARIIGVKVGKRGSPGELQGVFEGAAFGKLMHNAVNGLYGRLTAAPSDGLRYPVAMKQAVKTGPAQVYTTVDGTGPRLYDVTIRQVRYAANDTKSMIVEITDADLLACTGGIVQGMSGSPILKDGKLVGAITHVLVDDPTRGYAIFAENMLETARSIEQSQKQKDAS